MTLLHRVITSLALVGMTLAPVAASARGFSVKADNSASLKAVTALSVEKDDDEDKDEREESRAKKAALVAVAADTRAAIAARLEELRRLMLREFAEIRATIKADAEVSGSATTTATSTISVKARGQTVADVRHLINAYRQTVHAAEVQHDKTVAAARVTLQKELRAALEAKDKEDALAAFDAYMKTENSAEARRDGIRAEARTKFMTDLRALFS